MIKTLTNLLRQDKEKYRVPRKIRDVIPIRRIWNDGIFLVGSKYSKSYRFSDINYLVASREDKEVMFLAYSELLNGLDAGATTKITINNRALNKRSFEQSVLMPMKEDKRDFYRKEYNGVLLDKATGANGLIQEKYVTITVAKKDIEEARAYFARVGADLASHFAGLGASCTELDASERLRILHDFYRVGEEVDFHFDARDMMKKGHDFRDYICPDGIEKGKDGLQLGERFGRVLYLKDYASYIKDDMVTELTDLNRNMMLSIDIVPIPTDEAVREVENRLLGVETNITNWQRRQNANNNFSAVVPYDMELQRKETKEFLDDLTTRDQRMMLGILTLVLTADTKEQLDADTETVLSIARKHMCQMAVLKYQQYDGLNTVLPIGTRRINAFRTLTTESLAVFMPFKVQEIQDRGGIYFGENAISHNLILCNRENLLNQSAFILGVPGSGKSFNAKEQITFLMLNTEDDIMICDPEGEFVPLVEAMGKEMGTVIHMMAGGRDRLNAMYMVEGYGEVNPVIEKSQFVMSLVEQIDKKGVSPQHRSIIDRCTAQVYQEGKETGIVPTLTTLREKLLVQPEKEAREIALALELYTTGSLNIFGHGSNVDLDKRVVVFNIHDLGEQLKPAGLLVITDTMLNRVTLNWQKGKRTHVFIDEYHIVFDTEQGANFFTSAWRQFRKRGAHPTAITQNVEYVLDSVQASTMLSNSEFIIMFNQAARDREKLADLLNISKEQMSYVTNAEAGCGLIRYGRSLVPFVNRFPKDTKLYELMTTKPGEGVFGGGNE
ncbi:VirB4-like conjugal transfer ATPase, CD1110 family [Pseudoramibacter alactolyticus]|uniref:VirB4-like conjugal transfer ATPase, CD1110 family n=1 Tax=Pseudoramibacter alactolyticus TaxID=113287 RepID=UPI0028E4D8B9|nr:ATP-binding protein [Pseudoramibacter alactolyticus]